MSLVLNGSGTITGLNAGGLPSASVTQASLAANVAGNGPAFSAYSGTVQTVTSNTWTKVNLTVETFDTNNNFDSTTNYRFTPTVAGYYQITGSVNMDGGALLTNSLTAIYKNGSIYAFSGAQYAVATLNGFVPVVSSLIYFNGSTDYVELYGFNTCTSTPRFNTSSTATVMTGVLVRSA